MSDQEFKSDGRACDLLAAYEMGLLETSEKMSFEQHLAGCPDCLDEVYAMAPASVAMQADPRPYAGAAAAGLAAGRPALADRLRSGLAALLRPRVLAPVALAAALALVIIVPALDDHAPDRSPWQQLAMVEPLPYMRIEVRAGADEPEKLFHQGMDLYLQEEFGSAADKLGEAEFLLDRWPADAPALPTGLRDQTRIFRGVSLLLSDQAGQAVAPLSVAAEAPLPPLADRARWYLAQAYLLTDQPGPALETLRLVAASPVYGPRAQALIVELSAD